MTRRGVEEKMSTRTHENAKLSDRCECVSLDRMTYNFACIGFVLCVSTPEAVRYSIFRNISDSSSPVPFVYKILFFLFCYLIIRVIGRRSSKPFHRHKAFLLVMSLMQCAGFVLMLVSLGGAVFPQWVKILQSCLVESFYFAFVAYASFFSHVGTRRAISVLVVGVIGAGTIQIALTFLTFYPAAVCILCMAPLSVFFLILADRRIQHLGKEYLYEKEADHIDGGESIPLSDDSREQMLSDPYKKNDGQINRFKTKTGSVLSLCITIFMLSFIVGDIHLAWNDTLDEIYNMFVQLCTAIGAILAGNLVLLLQRYLEEVEAIEFTRLIVLPIAIGTLYVASLLEGSLIVLLVIPLNVIYVAILLLAWLAPFIYGAEDTSFDVSCNTFMAKRLGVIVGIAYIRDYAIGQFTWAISLIVVVFLFVLIVISSIQFINMYRRSKSRLSPVTINTILDPEKLQQRALSSLSQKYHLTTRESEVLDLLSRGRSASYIAETLVISDTTVKTHIKHIYQKTGISSKQLLMDLVEVEVGHMRAEVSGESDRST